MNVKNETNMQQNIQFLPDIMLSPLSLSEDLFPPLVAPKPQKISPIVSKDIAGNASPTYGNHITSQNAQQAFSPIHDYPIKYNQQNRYFYENYSNNSSQTSLGTPTPGQYIHGQQSPEFIIGSDGNPTPPSLLKTGHLYGNRTSTPELRLSMSSTGSRSPVIRLLIDEKKEKRRSMTSLTLKNDETALQKYAEAAKKLNDPNIQIDYAKFLINMEENHTKSNETNGSESVEEDPTTNKFREEIKYWINLLVKNNHPEALYIKGTWYEHGKYGKKVKPDKAYKLYLSSTKCDFSKAAYK
ncbi:13868_t:CDS:2, partial [Entrophospora sp. SA101]